MNNNPHILALARFPNLANVQVIVVFTILIYVSEFMLENSDGVAQVALFKGVGIPFEFC